MTAYAQYDIAGNVVKAIDARGNASAFDFRDSFGSPDGDARANAGSTELNNAGQYSYAFPTLVTKAGLTSYTQFDYYNGRPVDAEDANGVVSSGYCENEPLDRPTKVIRAANNSTIKSQSTFAYNDTTPTVTVTSDLNGYGDNLLEGQTLYDGLGRTTEQRTYEGGTNYIASQQQYDAHGRAYRTSNPFRPWNNETPLWTTTTFDALGRVLTLMTPDNAVVTTSYSGNTVTVTDQAGKARKSVTDGLGRLIQVYEAPNDSNFNYLTSYAYDALDDLTTVTQGTQPARNFVYDSLKRLTSATNPESGTISYQYDNNGNLLTKTDARPITTTYVYDALNRPTSRSYSDGTPPNYSDRTPTVTYTYDSGSVPNAKGRLTSTSSSVSAYSYTAYDALGRINGATQTLGGQNYSLSYAYDFAGHVKSITYPSLHVLNYSYDMSGRLGDYNGQLALTGNLGDGVTPARTYASISGPNAYDAAGRIQEEKYGTLTPLYHKQHFNIRGQLYDIRLSTVPWMTDQWNWNRGAITNSYDGRMTHQDPNSGPDNNGNLLRSESWVPNDDQISGYNWTQQNYAYDSLNRLTLVAEYQNGSTPSYAQSYTYDPWGNRTINMGNTNGGPTWGYQINAVQTVVDPNTNRIYAPNDPSHTLINYDAVGNQTKDYLTWNGTRTYDAENKMIGAANGTTDTYSYDGDGRRVKRKIGTLETWQVYGAGGELVAEYAPNAPATTPDKEYGYRSGQLLVTAAAVDLALGKTATQSSTFSNAGVNFTANLAVDGNTDGAFWDVSSATTNYGSQNWWQVDLGSSQSVGSIQVWPRTDCCPEMTANFYVFVSDNPFTSTDLTTTLNQSGVSNYWVANGNASVATVNVNRSGRYVRIQRNDSQYLVLAEVKVGKSTADVEWLVTDHLGTPRMIADASFTLAGIKRHDYLPFGEELFANQGGRTTAQGYTAVGTNAADGARQKFTLKERDIETGLDFFRTRYYSSVQGRFTSYDLIFVTVTRLVDPQRLNLYAYARNNPLKFIDPDGMDATITAKDEDEARKRFQIFLLGLRPADRSHVHFFVGDGKNGYAKGQFYVLVDANYQSSSGNFQAIQGAANDRTSVGRISVIRRGDTYTVRMIEGNIYNPGMQLTTTPYRGKKDFQGYTVFQMRENGAFGELYSSGEYTEAYVNGDQSDIQLAATMHHELRAHIVLGDFGRTIPRARHSDAYARGKGPPTSDADKEGEAAEKEARENAKKKP